MPKTDNVTMSLNSLSCGSITLDGFDIAKVTTDVIVKAKPGGQPVVELELRPGQMSLNLNGALVDIDDATRQLLLKLGWTPPTEGTEQ